MKTILLLFFIMSLGLTFSVPPLMAQSQRPPERLKAEKHALKGPATVGTQQTEGPLFSAEDRQRIRQYFGRKDERYQGKKDRSKKMPPGLAKRDELPPGLRKQLEKNGTLPPGLRGRRLPTDLERRLSRLGDRYERQKVGDQVVLIDAATRVILDVIYGVGR